jgi:hypothetical protein
MDSPQGIELLIRIDERVKQLGQSLDSDRAAWNSRANRQESEMAGMRRELDSLRLSRATFYGGAAVLSTVISIGVKVFLR